METKLYTIHTRADRDHPKVVGDISWIAVIPPLWALLNGLWIALVLMVALLVGVSAYQPLAGGTAYLALVLITVLDGDALMRMELRLFGWREVAAVEARTPEGAEELYLKGEAA